MASGSEITQAVVLDEAAILRSLNLNPADPNVQALILVCREYGLDPVLKHMVLISGRPYVTRDGLLHVAHRSGQFDGIEVLEEGESDVEWWAKVAVYRKDMGRPFTYRGRYPKKDAKHMAKFGPEMAVKVAEVMALRRAFDVTGIGAAEERWDAEEVIEAEPVDPATDDQLAAILAAVSAMTVDEKALVADWWKAEGYPALASGRLTEPQAAAVLAHPLMTPGPEVVPGPRTHCTACGKERTLWLEDPNTHQGDLFCPDMCDDDEPEDEGAES